jgi:hypothetical protein
MHFVGQPGQGIRHPRKDWQTITSGKSQGQQGLVITCKDSSNEAKRRRRGESRGIDA